MRWQRRHISPSVWCDCLLLRQKWRTSAAGRSQLHLRRRRRFSRSLKVQATFFPGNEDAMDQLMTDNRVRRSRSWLHPNRADGCHRDHDPRQRPSSLPLLRTLKSAGDVTSAAYTIKGVLEQARTYAMANNTYTWVGFYEEDVSQPSTNPPTPGVGRLVMSIVAAKDGVQGFDPNAVASPTNRLDIARLVQVGKLIKIDNVHLPLFAIPTGTPGNTFDTRPAVQNDPVVGYNDSRFGELNASPPNTAPAE